MNIEKLFYSFAASVALLCSTFISAVHAQDDDNGRIERALTELRQAGEQVMKQLEGARSEGAERKVAELEEKMAQIREKIQGIELQAKNSRQVRGANNRDARKEIEIESERATKERRVEQAADQSAKTTHVSSNRLEHARTAEKHLREANFMDMADMVHRRIGELEQEYTTAQSARRDNSEARRTEEVGRIAAVRRQAAEPEVRRELRETREPRDIRETQAPRANQAPREPANNERMGAALNEFREFQAAFREMRQEIEKLRREMNELREKIKN